jgi:hypothetical protein
MSRIRFSPISDFYFLAIQQVAVLRSHLVFPRLLVLLTRRSIIVPALRFNSAICIRVCVHPACYSPFREGLGDVFETSGIGYSVFPLAFEQCVHIAFGILSALGHVGWSFGGNKGGLSAVRILGVKDYLGC